MRTHDRGATRAHGGSDLDDANPAVRPSAPSPQTRDAREAIAAESQRKLAETIQRLDAHVSNSPLAIVEFDSDFVITRYSEEAERLFGWTADETLGRRMMDIPWLHEDDIQLVAREVERLISGKTPRSVNANRNVCKDGAVKWCEWYSSAIFDGDGELISVFSQVLDITARREGERLGEALNEIGAAVGSTFDRDEILERLFTMASDALDVDASAVAMVRGARWELRHCRGIDAGKVQSLLEQGRVPPPPEDRSRFAPIAIQDINEHERLASLAELGVRRMLAVPLLTGGEVAGVLEFAKLNEGPAFSEAEFDFAARLMPMVTVALDNARLFEREHRIASTLQQAVIASPKEIEGIESACLYRPASRSADVGGDFYDVFELPDRRVAVVIGDISGKGLAAAQLTSLVRNGVRAYALENPRPAWILDRVNRLLCHSVELGKFATVALAILDLDNDRLAYAVGGHPPAVISDSSGVRLLDAVHSPIVGGFAAAEFEQAEIEFHVGDRLLLYTDGLTESRRRGELFGTERLTAAVAGLRDKPVAAAPRILLEIALQYADGVLSDDTAIICVRRTA
jgi:PAS domain S-box-containing protein